MPRQEWMADVVADAFRGVKGYQVDVVSGWNRRGRTDFYPEGVMNHHTGPGSYSNLLNYMTYGSSISPLCNIATSRPINGIVRITICTAGRANHAGVGTLPWRRGQGSVGNARTIGIENQNSGKQDWPLQQVEGIRILTAALLLKLNKDVSRAIDHKTYTGRKVDRYATNVGLEQRAIETIMRNGFKPAPCEERVFGRGDYGDCVKKIQKRLNELGYSAGATDGAFGPKTESAVKSLQADFKLSVDGMVGPNTWGALESDDEWEVFWMSLTDEEKSILRDFARAIKAEGTNPTSFVKQLLSRHREDIPALQKRFEELDGLVARGKTSLQGVIIGGVNAIDAVRDMGYHITSSERTGAEKLEEE